MTIKSETDQILSLVTAQTQAIANLATAVANIHSGTTDVSGLQASIDKLTAISTDIQSQVEDAPAPQPAPPPATNTDAPAAPATAETPNA